METLNISLNAWLEGCEGFPVHHEEDLNDHLLGFPRDPEGENQSTP
jgi:hypothetical protein